MIDFRDQKPRLTCPVVTMGTFDGVHIGHQRLLQTCVQRARACGGESVVVTYYHHPLEVLHERTLPYLLTEKDHKEKLLRALGIDCVLYLRFDRTLAAMSPLEFLRQVMIDRVCARELVVGYDTHFGRGRSGNYSFLRTHAQSLGYRLTYVEPVKHDGEVVSSSHIRRLVREGDMSRAACLLGRPYPLLGIVVSGRRIGYELGYPTINLFPTDEHKLIPATGVYHTEVVIDGHTWPGVTNIGSNPTVSDDGRITIESHVLDWNGNLYGRHVELRFLARLRDEQRFETRDELVRAITGDIALVRRRQES
ncbi:MAG: bifunctional riboflavin kinase/FAD synthetase [Candidatus Cloacimonetes bacterium]|nr:bifunctional riboflavin kinase/FAD synthetase [Candidatus Cloacimonadota bacterium]